MKKRIFPIERTIAKQCTTTLDCGEKQNIVKVKHRICAKHLVEK